VTTRRPTTAAITTQAGPKSAKITLPAGASSGDHTQSSEYQRNAAAIRSQAALILRHGGTLFCGICRAPIVATDAIQVDHIIRLRDGGSHALSNLRPVHARCNASDR
jgi:5-methylcytosine-specific restriction endonuclease McrA